MKVRSSVTAIVLLLALGTGIALGETPELSRAEWAARLSNHTFEASGIAAPSTAQIIEALDIPATQVVEATYVGHAAACLAATQLGVIRPTAGGDFIVLSSGVAGAGTGGRAYPEPGTDFGFPDYDRATIRLRIRVPEGASTLSFDFNFLSAEYPDFVGSSFNDEFEAILTSSLGSTNIAKDGNGRTVSVNSALFFPVNDVDAGGTGYDIYCPDPSEVDSAFPGGLPDAGLTYFQHVEAAVPGNEIVTIEFRIFDRGDRILDSTAIVDNLRVGGIQIVDANPVDFNGLFIHQSSVMPSAIATGGRVRAGTVADGTSRLLIRYVAPQAGNVTLTLSGPAFSGSGKGHLSPVSSTTTGSTVSAHTVPVDGANIAFFLYTPPDAFDDFDWLHLPADVRRKEMVLDLAMTPDAGGSVVTESARFTLHRTPVLFVHGIRSKPDMWNHPLHESLWSRYGIRFEDVDYEATHTASFEVNFPRLAQSTRSLISQFDTEGIACSQVIVVAHSMGGVLARRWYRESGFTVDANYREGWIHKLMTIDTPHYGSPVPAVLLEIASKKFICPQVLPLISAIELSQGPIGDAHRDLSPGSEALAGLGQSNIPSHAVVGMGGSDLWINAPWPISAFTGVQTSLMTISVSPNCWTLPFFSPAIFEGYPHDYIVSAPSQSGGLHSSYSTTNDGLRGIHTSVCEDDEFWRQQLIPFLRTNMSGNLAPGFPPPVTALAADPASAEPAESATGMRIHTLVKGVSGPAIVSPAEGAVFRPGDFVPVQVDNGEWDISAQILADKSGHTAAVDPETGMGIMQLSDRAVGTLSLKLFSVSPSQPLAPSAFRNIVVVPEGTVTTLSISPLQKVLAAPGDEFVIHAYGEYGDGISRSIGSAAQGTGFQTDNTYVATVSPTGLVTAHHPGVTTVTVRNNGLQASARVEVLAGTPNVPPAVTLGGPYTLCEGDTLTLDVTGAFDPDASGGGALAYTWDIDGDGRTGDAVDPIIHLKAGQAGTYLVTLECLDPFGARTIVSTTVVVNSCGPRIDGTFPDIPVPGQEARLFGYSFGADPGTANRDTDIDNVTLNGQRLPAALFTGWTDDVIRFTVPTNFHGGSVVVTAGGKSSAPYVWSFDCAATDTTGPVLQGPETLEIPCAGTDAVAATDPRVVAWLEAVTVEDACDAEPQLEIAIPGYLQVGTNIVTFTARDQSGNATIRTAEVRIVDQSPPELTVAVNRHILWPPNHKMVEVALEVSVDDNCDPAPVWVLASVTSSEPDNGTGDGDFPNDIQGVATGTADGKFALRSERSGSGDGRIYRVTVTAHDGSGNTTSVTVEVTVPHGQAAAGIVVAEGNPGAIKGPEVHYLIPGSSLKLNGIQAPSETWGIAVLCNTAGSVSAQSVFETDVDGDDLHDYLVSFDRKQAKALMTASDVDDGRPVVALQQAQGLCILLNSEQTATTQLNLAELVNRLRERQPIVEGPAMHEKSARAPALTSLLGASPNPFNPNTTISFRLGSTEDVSLDIFDVAGRLVVRLLAQPMPAGDHSVLWSGLDMTGERVASGVYLCRLATGSTTDVMRMMLLK